MGPVQKEFEMNHTANGPFEITLNPELLSSTAKGTGLGRMSLDKQFHGELEAASQGEMLSFRSSVQGSAGYVAMETVHGALHGRSGSFVLQHSSTMNRGAPVQSITVVPDSGTDELSGLTGSMVIKITDGQHSYKFDYALPDQQI
ncbi:MAG: DUF3224 domain-containing protein [Pseudomonas sp.]